MKHYFLLFLFILAGASLFGGPVGKHGNLKVDGVKLVDEQNQPVVLRGVSFGWHNWLNWMEKNKISWVSWSISDKNETCSMLQPSASSTGNWNDNDVEEWGQITRNCIK